MTSVDVDAVASTDFALVRKGFEPDAVRAFRDRVADDLRRAHAEAEAARLEADRLRRELQEARAELASEPHTDEAIAILGDDATRIIHAAQQSSKEIVAAAEAAAEDIRAKAREEAGRIADESRRESEDFGGRLSGQADEVRSRLRDEIRKARIEFAEEADRLRADARYEAEAIVEQAREDARAVRTEAEEAASERQDHVAVLAAERIASAEATAEARLAEATARARALTSEAEACRDAVLGELQAHREVLESHVRALREAQTRARADIGAAQTMLSALTTELDHVRLRDVDVPPLELDIEIPARLSSEVSGSEADGGAIPEAPVPADEASAEAGDDESAPAAGSELSAEPPGDEGDAAPAEPSADEGGEAGAETFDDVVEPSDDEIDALFERVVAHRGGVEVAEPEPEPAVRATKDAAGDDADWGFADDAGGYVDRGEVDVVRPGAEVQGMAATTPDEVEPTQTRRRVLAALHQLAVDTGEIPIAVVSGEDHMSGNGDSDPMPGDEGASMGAPGGAPGDAPGDADDSDALDLVPAVTRKVKRALQEVENAALDTDLEGGSVDVIAVFSEYLVPSAVEAMALGLGAAPDVDLTDDAEVVVRVVCGTWAGELGAGLTGVDATAVATVVREARGGAEAVAADLARTAFRAGRDRAARSPR